MYSLKRCLRSNNFSVKIYKEQTLYFSVLMMAETEDEKNRCKGCKKYFVSGLIEHHIDLTLESISVKHCEIVVA